MDSNKLTYSELLQITESGRQYIEFQKTHIDDLSKKLHNLQKYVEDRERALIDALTDAELTNSALWEIVRSPGHIIYVKAWDDSILHWCEENFGVDPTRVWVKLGLSGVIKIKSDTEAVALRLRFC